MMSQGAAGKMLRNDDEVVRVRAKLEHAIVEEEPGALVPSQSGLYLGLIARAGVKIFLLDRGRIDLASFQQGLAASVYFRRADGVVAPVDQLNIGEVGFFTRERADELVKAGSARLA